MADIIKHMRAQQPCGLCLEAADSIEGLRAEIRRIDLGDAAREAIADFIHERGWELRGKSTYDIADMLIATIRESRSAP